MGENNCTIQESKEKLYLELEEKVKELNILIDNNEDYLSDKANNIRMDIFKIKDKIKELENYNLKKLRDCAYTILDNAQAIMMECHNESPYPGYLLEKIKPIENDIKVIKSICLKGEN